MGRIFLVLSGFLLRLIRALSLPFIVAFVSLRWFLAVPVYPFASLDVKGATSPYIHQRRAGLLMSIPEFGCTGLLPLTNVYLMSAWFINLLTLNGYHYCDLFMAL